MYLLRQNQSGLPLLFLMLDSTDHVSPKTGLVSGSTLTVSISKAGSAFAAPAGAVSELGSGWYQIAGNSTDSNGLGPLIIHATGTGADPTDMVYNVVSFDPYDAVRMGMTSLPAVTAGQINGLPLTNAVSGKVAVSSLDANVITATAIATNAITSTKIASGTIDSNKFASGAITSTVLATDCIGSAQLATTGVQEIRNAITGGAYALSTDANGMIRIVDGTGTGELDTLNGGVDVRSWGGNSTTIGTDANGLPVTSVGGFFSLGIATTNRIQTFDTSDIDPIGLNNLTGNGSGLTAVGPIVSNDLLDNTAIESASVVVTTRELLRALGAAAVGKRENAGVVGAEKFYAIGNPGTLRISNINLDANGSGTPILTL